MLRSRLVVAVISLALVCVLPLRAQTRPHLAGVWVYAVEGSYPADPNSHSHLDIVIAQDAQTFTLTQTAAVVTLPKRTDGGLPTVPFVSDRVLVKSSSTYVVDGADHPSPDGVSVGTEVGGSTPPTQMTPEESTYRAFWTRDQLIIMTRDTVTLPARPGQAAVRTRRVMRRSFQLDSRDRLIVQRLALLDPVFDGPSQEGPLSVLSTYRRAPSH